jgi:penicillin-binding protein 2
MAPLAEINKQDGAPELRQRVRWLYWLLFVAFFGLSFRLVHLQIFQGERYTFLSENNRIRIKRVPGTRGMIFDRSGQLLVDSRPSFDLIFVPEDSDDPENTLRYLARHLKWDEYELLETYEQSKGRAAFDEMVLGRDVEWATVVAVETHQLDLPGVNLRVRPRRNYADGPMAAHILGYMGEINQKQLHALKEHGYRVGDEIGQYGLERHWEEALRGHSGGQQVEVDALGRRMRVLHEVSDVPGYTMHLTLDRQLQDSAYEALRGKQGTIVAIDVRDGGILAMASTPAFDPNTFARGIKTDEWNGLIKDRLRPLSNRATQGQYPPGSTFKIIMAIAALEEGVVNPDAFISDPGFYFFGNRRFRDWKQGGHGMVNLHKSLVESCDTYYYQLSTKLGVNTIAKWSRAFGLGERTGVDLDDERSGLIPDTEWKRKRFRQPWYPGETLSVGIGQGYVTTTPLQLANMMAAVANGGKLYRPRLVNKVETVDGSTVREYEPELIRTIELKPDTLARVHKALTDVVQGPGGTGAPARSQLIDIAGKTGTAQVIEMKGAYLKNEHLGQFQRDHAWFVAYAPAQNPRIALAVLIEHGGHGSSAAAPLARKVLEKFAELETQAAEKQMVRLNGDSRAD